MWRLGEEAQNPMGRNEEEEKEGGGKIGKEKLVERWSLNDTGRELAKRGDGTRGGWPTGVVPSSWTHCTNTELLDLATCASRLDSDVWGVFFSLKAQGA